MHVTLKNVLVAGLLSVFAPIVASATAQSRNVKDGVLTIVALPNAGSDDGIIRRNGPKGNYVVAYTRSSMTPGRLTEAISAARVLISKDVAESYRDAKTPATTPVFRTVSAKPAPLSQKRQDRFQRLIARIDASHLAQVPGVGVGHAVRISIAP
jgi:hypothetical protein